MTAEVQSISSAEPGTRRLTAEYIAARALIYNEKRNEVLFVKHLDGNGGNQP